MKCFEVYYMVRTCDFRLVGCLYEKVFLIEIIGKYSENLTQKSQQPDREYPKWLLAFCGRPGGLLGIDEPGFFDVVQNLV